MLGTVKTHPSRQGYIRLRGWTHNYQEETTLEELAPSSTTSTGTTSGQVTSNPSSLGLIIEDMEEVLYKQPNTTTRRRGTL